MKIYKFYVPWDFDMLVSGITSLLGNVGTIFNVGMWIFIIIAGVALIRSIIGWLGG